jgi:hypothetical protein
MDRKWVFACVGPANVPSPKKQEYSPQSLERSCCARGNNPISQELDVVLRLASGASMLHIISLARVCLPKLPYAMRLRFVYVTVHKVTDA